LIDFISLINETRFSSLKNNEMLKVIIPLLLKKGYFLGQKIGIFLFYFSGEGDGLHGII
jgi:hypothetical protein